MTDLEETSKLQTQLPVKFTKNLDAIKKKIIIFTVHKCPELSL